MKERSVVLLLVAVLCELFRLRFDFRCQLVFLLLVIVTVTSAMESIVII